MRLTDYIPFGRQNAISRTELALKLGLNDRALRTAVRAYRNTWVSIEPFICSNSTENGYWLSNNIDEIRDVRNWYYGYIASGGTILNNIDRQLARLDGSGLVYVRAHYRHIKPRGA